ncbi:MAG: 6-phosphogluconolactonase [Pseudomonadota bacterium]
MTVTVAEFQDRAELADALANRVATELRTAIGTKGTASFAVPGGTTPGPFLTALSGASVDWVHVRATLTDERQVPESHERSNARLVRETLMQGAAGAATFLPLNDPYAANVALADHLPLDAVVLGMGNDLHTASLFPGASALGTALSPPDDCHAMAIEAPGAPEPRVTLTAPTLSGAAFVAILITGDDKRASLEKAMATGPVEDAPVRAILTATDVTVYWAP